MRPYLPFICCLCLLLGCGTDSDTTQQSPDPSTASAATKDSVRLPLPVFQPVFHTDFTENTIRAWPLWKASDLVSVGFWPSPFEKNKFWIMPLNKPPFELDLKTGTRRPLSEKFGEAFFNQPISANLIRIDPFESDVVWFVGQNTGIMRYDYALRKAQVFNPAPKQEAWSGNMIFSEKNVWFETAAGLTRFERASGSMQSVQKAPEMITPGRLAHGEYDQIIVGHMVYDPANDCWSRMQYLRGVVTPRGVLEANGWQLIGSQDATFVRSVSPEGKTADAHRNSTEMWVRDFLTTPRSLTQPPFFWAFAYGKVHRLDGRDGSVAQFSHPLTPDAAREALGAVAPNDVWFFRSDYWLCLEQRAEEMQIFEPMVQGDFVGAVADSRHLYLLSRDSFFIINKGFIKKQPASSSVFQKYAMLRSMADSVVWQNPSAANWRAFQQRLRRFRATMAEEKSPLMLGLLYRVEQSVGAAGSLPEADLRVIFAAPDLDSALVDVVGFGLMKTLVQRGNLREAIVIGKKWLKKRPEAKFLKTERGNTNDWANLLNTMQQLDSLDATRLTEDRKLLEKGQLLTHYCENSIFLPWEFRANYSIADSVYRRLLHKFPNSEWADDAQFALNTTQIYYGEGEDGSNHPEAVAMWRKFVKKYPNSNLRAAALFASVNPLGRDSASLLTGLGVLAEIESRHPEFLQDKEMAASFMSTKSDFQYALDFLELAFSAHLKKSKVRMGDPVEVVFSLKNTGSKKQLRWMTGDKKMPNFEVHVTPASNGQSECLRPIIFVESQTSAWPSDQKNWGERTLMPRQTVSETWDICKNIRKSDAPKLGRFEFDQAGIYEIKAIWHLGGDGIREVVLRLEVN